MSGNIEQTTRSSRRGTKMPEYAVLIAEARNASKDPTTDTSGKYVSPVHPDDWKMPASYPAAKYE